MAVPEELRVSLRILGDDLVPSEITMLLECLPTKSQSKGDVIEGKKTGKLREAKTGGWWLLAPACFDGNLNSQILGLLALLNDEVSVWTDLSDRFKLDLFVGVFLSSGNDGIGLSPKTLKAIGDRGIELDLDIYSKDLS